MVFDEPAEWEDVAVICKADDRGYLLTVYGLLGLLLGLISLLIVMYYTVFSLSERCA